MGKPSKIIFVLLIIIFIGLLVENVWNNGFGINGQSGRTNIILIGTIFMIVGLFVKNFKK